MRRYKRTQHGQLSAAGAQWSSGAVGEGSSVIDHDALVHAGERAPSFFRSTTSRKSLSLPTQAM
jgi:hypothetical protein